MSTSDQPTPTLVLAPPSPGLNYLLEGPRTLQALTCCATLAPFAGLIPFDGPAPLLRLVPKGDGHTVVALPGLYAGDPLTLPLRALFRRLGYATSGWGLGRNLGPTDAVAELPTKMVRLSETTGGPVSLIGWSLGGIYAREIARVVPHAIRHVITLGSAINVPDIQTVQFGQHYRSFELGGPKPRLVEFKLSAEPLAMPSTSIFSRDDGFVDWQAAAQEPSDRTENIEVRGSHLGLGFNPAVLLAVADRLGRTTDGILRPFRPPFPFRLWYPRLGQPVDTGGAR
jgi:hypothetical protein